MAKKSSRAARSARLQTILKAPTGIEGFDAITGGGLPAGRPTLLCGGPGCGKTIFAMEFLVSFGGIALLCGVAYFKEWSNKLDKKPPRLAEDGAPLRNVGPSILTMPPRTQQPAECAVAAAYSASSPRTRASEARRRTPARAARAPAP